MEFLLQHTVVRRLLTVSLVVLAALLFLVTLPLWLPLSLLAGLLIPSWRSATRCLSFIAVYLLCESVGVLAAGLVWLGMPVLSAQQYVAANRGLQLAWAATLKSAAEWLFRLRFEIDVPAESEVEAAIVLPRHTSIGDTVLPLLFYAQPRGLAVRYVLKQELLLDPCLDIVGNRLPNVFLDRDAENMTVELAALRNLAGTAAVDDALVIYMEGTRYSVAKRNRVLAKLRASDAQYPYSWNSVLPPRMAGALALMEGAPQKDLLFFAHTGFEVSGSFTALFNGGWLDTTVRLHWWRVPAAQIPAGADERKALLLDQWQKMDRIVSELQQEGSARAS